MASQPPPYHTPVYLENLWSNQVAETVTDSTGTQVIELDNINTANSEQQQWNLDPFDMANNEYFVKLNCDKTQVIQSPEEECGRAIVKTQGDRYANGGIQLWILEQYSIGSNVWVLKNFKTKMYLTVKNESGQSKAPVIVCHQPDGLGQDAQWKIIDA